MSLLRRRKRKIVIMKHALTGSIEMLIQQSIAELHNHSCRNMTIEGDTGLVSEIHTFIYRKRDRRDQGLAV